MEQNAGDNAQQIQGQNVYVGMSYSDVKDLCTTLIQSELALYTQHANLEAQQRFNNILNKLLDAMSKIDEKYRSRFQEPAIQFAANETFKEYIRSGKEDLSDDLIDLMIERICVEEYSTKQALIDEARQVLPKLSSTTVAILAILTFSKLIIKNKKSDFIARLQKLSPLLHDIGNPHSIDIAYLEQARCGQSLSFVKASDEFAEMMQKKYSALFTHPIPIDEFKKIVEESEWNKGDAAFLGTLLSLFDVKDNNTSFNYSVLNESIFLVKKKELLDASNSILKHSKPYSKDEVEKFFLEIDKNWQNVFNLFHREDVKSFMISPVGNYIASRKLTKLLGEEISINLFYRD